MTDLIPTSSDPTGDLLLAWTQRDPETTSANQFMLDTLHHVYVQNASPVEASMIGLSVLHNSKHYPEAEVTQTAIELITAAVEQDPVLGSKKIVKAIAKVRDNFKEPDDTRQSANQALLNIATACPHLPIPAARRDILGDFATAAGEVVCNIFAPNTIMGEMVLPVTAMLATAGVVLSAGIGISNLYQNHKTAEFQKHPLEQQFIEAQRRNRLLAKPIMKLF
jgi:hypothetical protein